MRRTIRKKPVVRLRKKGSSRAGAPTVIFKPASTKFVLWICGLVGAGLVWFLGLPAAINGFLKEFPHAAESLGIWMPVDQRMAGDWSLVQTCDPSKAPLPELSDELTPAHPANLDLHLDFRGSAISGGILSAGLSANAPEPEAFLDGVADGAIAKVRVFDWVDGKPVSMGHVALRRAANDCLRFEAVDPAASPFFPANALLARQPAGYFDGLPREGGLLQGAIDAAVKDIYNKRRSKKR